jgi:hypothetical protein
MLHFVGIPTRTAFILGLVDEIIRLPLRCKAVYDACVV